MSEVASKVKAIIVERLGVSESAVTPEANFTSDLGADSLDTVEMIMDFENAFDIKIPDEEAEKITTVGEAIEHIEKAVAAK
ncbi:MAG TPA: acyl carrier protein [Candidatus Barnesiella excrementipullorum]|jgi:acyl carrier protein|uniref:Acyl carrier protein n=1 Tax=Candidatus Barnesiella excrementipullorum TaxID=2838479 RepID=A0A9D1VR52_9BACT|nr:acyl carrier protein [Candidatus Barnesiella excrementipullorum]